MTQIETLERAALAAHRDGIGWSAFWQQHHAAIVSCEPIDRMAYHRLVRRLTAILVSGTAEVLPIGDDPEPWLKDDQAKPADVGTRAKLQPHVIRQTELWPAPSVPPARPGR